MKSLNFKKLWPYLAAILFFLIVTLVYFSPLLQGKQILQSDIIHFKGMSKEIVDFREKTGQEPLWTNAMFGGMPAYQISTKYTGNLLRYVDKILTLGLPHPANLVFLYFLGFFILMLVLGADPWLAAAGATAFAFSSYFFIIIDAGHNSKAHAIGYMAPVMAGIILVMNRKYLWGGVMTAIFLSLEVYANHPQITYYLAFIVLLYGLFELIRSMREKQMAHFLKAAGILTISLLFAVLTNIATLWATWEYGKYTIRGKTDLTSEKENRTSGLDKDYATQWSYGIGESMTLLIPNFNGGSSNVKLGPGSKLAQAMKDQGVPEENIGEYVNQPLPFLYWGPQPFTSGPVYAGAILVFLFVLGLIIVKGPARWWLLSATILSLMLSWGHHFMSLTEFFMHYVPGYNKFRAVSMTLVIAEFCIPLLGIMALKEMADGKQERKKLFRALQIAFGITAGLSLLFALAPGMFLSFVGKGDAAMQQRYQLPDWFMQAIRDDRLRLLRLDALRSFVFILLAALAIWAILYNKIRKEYAFIAITLMILADLFPVNKRYLNDDNFTSPAKVAVPYEPTAANNQILADQDPNFRVLNLTLDPYLDASTSYFHKSIGGYHGAKLRRYQEIIDHGIDGEVRIFAGSMRTDSLPVINMLNTKYFILPGQDKQPMAYPNAGALGHAWFVNQYKIVANADEEIREVTRIRPDSVAVVDQQFAPLLAGFTPGKDSGDFIRLEKYAPNHLEYQYRSGKDGLAVFSEIYYPKGWDAYVDGKLTPHFRANYILRAMVLPAGGHKVEFRFEPAAFFVGEKISLASSLALILITVVMAGMAIRHAMRRDA